MHCHLNCLVVDRAQRHEPLLRPQGRFADRRRIRRIRLVAMDVRLHVRRRDLFYLVPERRDLPAPMVRARTSLHRHHARRKPAKKLQQPRPPNLANEDRLTLGVDAVNLKNALGQIEPDTRDLTEILARLAHGRLPFRWGSDNIHLGALDAVGAPSTPSP